MLEKPMELINRARGLYQAHQEESNSLSQSNRDGTRAQPVIKYRFANDRWASPMPLWIKGGF